MTAVLDRLSASDPDPRADRLAATRTATNPGGRQHHRRDKNMTVISLPTRLQPPAFCKQPGNCMIGCHDCHCDAPDGPFFCERDGAHSHVAAVQDRGGSQEHWRGWDGRRTREQAEQLARDAVRADTLWWEHQGERPDATDLLDREFGDRWHDLISGNVAPGWSAVFITDCTEPCEWSPDSLISGEPWWTSGQERTVPVPAGLLLCLIQRAECIRDGADLDRYGFDGEDSALIVHGEAQGLIERHGGGWLVEHGARNAPMPAGADLPF